MKKVLFTALFLCFAVNIYAQAESIFGSGCSIKGWKYALYLYEKDLITLDNTSLKDAYALVVKDLNDNNMRLYHYESLYKKYPKMPKKSVTLSGNIDKDIYASYNYNIDIKNDNNTKIEIKISAFGKTGDIILEQIGKNVQVTRKTAILDTHSRAARHNPENKPGSITNGWQKVDDYYDEIEFLCSGEKAKANEVMAQSFYTCDDCTYEKYFKGMDIKSTYNALFQVIPKTMENMPKDLPLQTETLENPDDIFEFNWENKNDLYISISSKETNEYYTDIEFMQDTNGVKVHLSGYGAYPN